MELFLSGAGFTVNGIAKTAPEAVDLARQFRPDLALLDVRLADGTDGTDAARILRENLSIPSILVTGHLDVRQARECGAVGLLKKPYDPKRLVEMIDALMESAQTGQAPPAASGLFVSETTELHRRA